MTQTTTQDIQWFIDTVLLGNIRDMICKQEQHYLGFGVVACAIEFLGACMDSYPLDKLGHSRQRFENAIKAHFDAKYHPYATSTSPYDLYKHLRCGMAHIMRPHGKIAFTTQSESSRDGTQHLQIFTTLDKLVLVSETFHMDFAVACNSVKQQMAVGAYKRKLTHQYLPITQIQP